jgi:hypothetical protein
VLDSIFMFTGLLTGHSDYGYLDWLGALGWSASLGCRGVTHSDGVHVGGPGDLLGCSAFRRPTGY